jgi:hypothetical protein
MRQSLDESREMVLGRRQRRFIIRGRQGISRADCDLSLVLHAPPNYFIVKIIIAGHRKDALAVSVNNCRYFPCRLAQRLSTTRLALPSDRGIPPGSCTLMLAEIPM